MMQCGPLVYEDSIAPSKPCPLMRVSAIAKVYYAAAKCRVGSIGQEALVNLSTPYGRFCHIHMVRLDV